MQDGDKPETAKTSPPNNLQPANQPTDAAWRFNPDNKIAAPNHSSAPATVSWTASEFIAHEKAASWYVILAGGAILLAIFIYLLTHEIMPVIIIIIVTALFGFYAARKPRVLEYSLDNSGLRIGPKFYPYTDFKSFSVLDEDGVGSIWLMPLKRFMPSLTIYYALSDENKITNALSSYLPFVERDHDMVERLMRRVRF